MQEFNYFMPTKVFIGQNIIRKKANLFKTLGKKAFIITGKNSSRKNGSLNDIIYVLKNSNIEYIIFDSVEENPSLETIESAVSIAQNENIDFIIGIGGGSPIDASKAIGVLLKNKGCSVNNLFNSPELESLPIIAIPTTAGTGTEVTPYAILTDNKAKTKRNFAQKIFPKIAFLDATYLMGTPDEITINTAVDALSHLIEGFLSAKSNLICDACAEKGLKLFSECMASLNNKDFSFEIREKLLLASTLGGMVISQAGTSLPHGMGYPLTYFHGIKHGKANGLLLKAYLEICNKSSKVDTILHCLGLKSIEEFGDFLDKILHNDTSITEEELKKYSKAMIENTAKLKNHPDKVTEEDIFKIYKSSLFK
ncbi:1,3-propanediol dehydrogenase [Clostridium tepidiprofundi DSM 19306]|uniref:1,3-propanediol dehydrogenase n=1 Tax=Clostridium tepidiprofundi DSM 19306 TaxID=1121338 RepID=A0A151B6B5_9CLOT|nr:iron-containing alcohol dehydrogenase family protein [Clostridium tepidiprofundi]KYH35468.1 1,3-propanediol dehydrogenase [Clostridium tepidiprofundi DSM 19306]